MCLCLCRLCVEICLVLKNDQSFSCFFFFSSPKDSRNRFKAERSSSFLAQFIEICFSCLCSYQFPLITVSRFFQTFSNRIVLIKGKREGIWLWISPHDPKHEITLWISLNFDSDITDIGKLVLYIILSYLLMLENPKCGLERLFINRHPPYLHKVPKKLLQCIAQEKISNLASSSRHPIGCFHSRGQHLCKFIGTTESVCIRKELNSQMIGLEHQHGRRFIVLGHQYGRRDVM